MGGRLLAWLRLREEWLVDDALVHVGDALAKHVGVLHVHRGRQKTTRWGMRASPTRGCVVACRTEMASCEYTIGGRRGDNAKFVKEAGDGLEVRTSRTSRATMGRERKGGSRCGSSRWTLTRSSDGTASTPRVRRPPPITPLLIMSFQTIVISHVSAHPGVAKVSPKLCSLGGRGRGGGERGRRWIWVRACGIIVQYSSDSEHT